MTHEERAHQLAIELGLPEGSPERRLAAAFADGARVALERAAQWHEDENSRHLRMAQANSHRSYPDAAANHRATAHKHREYAEAIRALPPGPAASITHSASCNISEKLSDVCSCGAKPADPDPREVLHVWRAQCGVCDGVFDHPEAVSENPQPHGAFCPQCRSRGLSAPGVLHFKALPEVAPDPREALARLFADWWRTPVAKWDLETASRCGLIHPIDAGEYALTDLGKAAISLAGGGSCQS